MGRKWEKHEDDLLRELVKVHGKQWSLIATHIPNRTASQISSRWEKCIDPNLTKGPFTPQEDAIVVEYVKKNGPTNWPKLCEQLIQRSPKQCRERWFNHLNPGISKGSWTREEDSMIFEYHKIYGPKWALIAKHLSGRSDNSIKNRWNSSISKRMQIDQSGNQFLIEDSSKRSQKEEKTKAKPNLQLSIPVQQNFSRINVKLVGDPQTMYYNHGFIPGMQPMFAPQMNAPIVEPIHPSKPPNETQALPSPKDLYSQIGGTPGIGSELFSNQATPNGFGFFGSPFGNPPSLFSPNKKNGDNALYK